SRPNPTLRYRASRRGFGFGRLSLSLRAMPAFVNDMLDLVVICRARFYLSAIPENPGPRERRLMNWTESLLGVTRAHLLALLRRSRRSINELAKALGVTDNAVRIHIAAMQRDGLVQTAGVERGTGGKPAQLYEITPE